MKATLAPLIQRGDRRSSLPDGKLPPMIDEFAKEYLHSDLREARATMLWKLEGLSEYDARRPLTYTGTNLLGLVKHLSTTEAWYFGKVFGRPFPGQLPRWDESADPDADPDAAQDTGMWATEDESLTETSRHAGHADILREQLDGAVGFDPENMAPREQSAAHWENLRSQIEQAARAATGDD